MDLEALIQRRNELLLIHNKLSSDLARADELMRKVGFSDGIETVKNTVLEIFDKEEKDDLDAA